MNNILLVENLARHIREGIYLILPCYFNGLVYLDWIP